MNSRFIVITLLFYTQVLFSQVKMGRVFQTNNIAELPHFVDLLTYSTVRITCPRKNGQVSVGTGFFVIFKNNPVKREYVPVLITNKHVVDGAEKAILTFTTVVDKKPSKTLYVHVIDNLQATLKKHPQNDVDLCALPIASVLRDAEAKKIEILIKPFPMSVIPTEAQLKEFSQLDEIVMIGYPNGICDSENNQPIFRRGVTATNPNIDYNGKKQFLVDLPVFPGSSGSPIVSIREASYYNKRTMSYTFDPARGPRLLLLGVTFATYLQSARGELKAVDIPTAATIISETMIPINLGLVIKAERIVELEQLF